MRPAHWSRNTEGAVALILVSLGLLVYGIFNERMFALGGSTLPAAALLVVLGLSALDLFRRSEGFRESREAPLPVRDAFVGAALCSLYAAGVIYVGLVVSTAAALFLVISYLRQSLRVRTLLAAVGTAGAIWFVFVYLGRAYFGQPWLF